MFIYYLRGLFKTRYTVTWNNFLVFTFSSTDVNHNSQPQTDDIEPADSVSNAPRRGSDNWSEAPAEYLDLPDHTHQSYHNLSQLYLHSESIRSIGDVDVERNSDVASMSMASKQTVSLNTLAQYMYEIADLIAKMNDDA